VTTPRACTHVRDIAPELALGVLDGDERAEVLEHLASCVECRAFADELSGIGDSLLLLAPAADPPLGFESRVAARLAAEPPNIRHRRARAWARTVALAAAAAVVAALLTAALVGNDEHDALVHANLASSRSGERVGQVWAYDGDRDWLFMTVDNPWAADNPYVCDAVLRDGRTIRLGRFQAHDGKGAWGEAVDVSLHDVRAIRVLTDDGTVVATARLNA
jgi:anti-sigma-K factor RskA